MIKLNYKNLLYTLSNNAIFKKISKKYKYEGDAIIFCYHRVLPEKLMNKNNYPDKSLVTSITNFENHLKFFKDNYACISIDDLLDTSKDYNYKHKICITFDDGYLDNIDYVLPIIDKYQIPITIYISSRFLEKNVYLWWYELWELIDQNILKNFFWKGKDYSYNINSKNLKINTYKTLSKLMLNETDFNQKKLLEIMSGSKERINYEHIFMKKKHLLELDENPLVTIGSHSHSHTRFSILNKTETKKEIESSIKILNQYTNNKVSHFAYPYGQSSDFNSDNTEIIKACGLKTIANTINKNISVNNIDTFHLPRYGISNLDDLNSINVKISGFHSLVKDRINGII